MATLRIGIAGSRFAAHLHLLAYRRVFGVDARLAAVTSPTVERRDAFARESGATPYPTLAAMLPHVDVVDVCSPPVTHEPAALEAIEAGKHVVIEKPFTGAFTAGGGAREALLEDALASATRKSGDPTASIPIYQKALVLDPKHRGAHEYIGEAHLILGNLAKAKEHLTRLDSLCFFSCEEYRDLK